MARNIVNAMRYWKPQPIEKSREVKLAAQRAIEEARAKQETREFVEAQKRKHAQSLQAVAATLEAPPVNRHPTTTQPERFANIFEAVCKEFGVQAIDVRSRLRHPRIVAARMVMIHLARKHTLLSYPDIQMLMGTPESSHSTAITAHQRLERKLDAPMFVGDERTFREVVDRFNGDGLCFGEVGNG